MEECNCNSCRNIDMVAEELHELRAKTSTQEVIEVTEQELSKKSVVVRLSEVEPLICGTRDDGLVLGELEDIGLLVSGVADLAEEALDYDSKEQMREAFAKIAHLLYWGGNA